MVLDVQFLSPLTSFAASDLSIAFVSLKAASKISSSFVVRGMIDSCGKVFTVFAMLSALFSGARIMWHRK